MSEFPQAKFILTIRNCYSWLESFLNYTLSRRLPLYWQKFGEFRYGSDSFDYAPEEKILADHQMRPLAQLLSRWATHQRQVLKRVPSDRLLIIRTHELDRSIPRLAEFLNIAPKTLDAHQAHLYKTAQQRDLLRQIDHDFLAAKVAEYCGDLMQTYFPEVHSLADARRLEGGGL